MSLGSYALASVPLGSASGSSPAPTPSVGGLVIDNEWPEELPLPFIDYNGAPRNSTIMSDDSSPVIIRRSRSTRGYRNLAVAWVFKDGQFEVFKDFLLSDLGNGTAQFKIELRYPLNSALTEWAVRLEDSYEATFEDGMWKVAAVLDLVNPINN